MRALVLAAGIGCAAVGVFFAFSAFVLSALARLPDPRSAEAMRSINVLAVRAPLMAAPFGTAAMCLALGIVALRRGEPLVAVTIVANVPLNDQLAAGPVGEGAR